MRIEINPMHWIVGSWIVAGGTAVMVAHLMGTGSTTYPSPNALTNQLLAVPVLPWRQSTCSGRDYMCSTPLPHHIMGVAG